MQFTQPARVDRPANSPTERTPEIMGLFRLNPAIDALAGKILGPTGGSGLVFMHNLNCGNVFRTWVMPDNPQTPLQSSMRNYLAQCAVAYKGINAAQAALWTATAIQINRTNKLGLTYQLTGITLFTMVNFYRLMNAQSLELDIPEIVKPLKPVGITTVILTTSVLLTVVADYTGNADSYFGLLNVSAILPGEARQARPNDCRLLDPTIANNIIQVSTNVVTWPIEVTDGAFTAGDRIGLEMMTLSDEYVPGDKTLIGNYEISAP